MATVAGRIERRRLAVTRGWQAPLLAPAPAIGFAEALTVVAIVLLAVAARAVALLALDQPLVSDGLAYFTMAQTLLTQPLMHDHYGNAALYSPGYPLLLAATFKLFGIDPAVARALNLALGAATVVLTWALARKATARPAVALIAAAGMALLIPAIAGTELIERENLSVPMLLAYLLACLAMIGTRRPLAVTAIAGVLFGFGLLAGMSSLFTGSAFLAAVLLRRGGWGAATAQLGLFALAIVAFLAPWVAHVDAAVGKPMLSTNGGINLYVGNNPAATGYYVPLKDTPAGPGWHERRARLGEAGLSTYLTDRAVSYALANPGRTILLDIRKLYYFWLPDTPDAADENHGLAVAAIRWAGAAQHLLILALVGAALFGWRRWSDGVRLIVLAILAFWAIHGIVYVITRYRAPAMPLMLVLAAIPVADRIERRRKA